MMGAERNRIRVLHVDDEPDFAETAAAFLRREDDRFEIETATSANEGSNALATTEFDCIVSDYDMPGETGLEFLEHVREDHPELPFLLYTGKGSEDVASDAISAGVTDYLQKKRGTSQYAVLANRIRNAVERYRAQRKLAERETRLNLFVEQSPLGVIEWDEEFRVVRQNASAKEILGYPEDELVGRSWEAIVPDSELNPVSEVVTELLENAGGYHSINENVCRGGERIVCEWHNRVVTDETGAVVAIFSQFQAVTDRKGRQREQALRETAGRLQALFEESPDMINVHDSAGNIIDPNPRLCEQTGYDRAELVEMKVWELDTTVDRSEVRDLWQTMEPGSQVRAEGEFLRKDGNTFPVEVNIRCHSIGGKRRFIVISRDISEQKQREEQLEQFASVISHDLRNPLNVAQARLELAQEQCDSDHLDLIEQSHARIDALISDLLSLAREGHQVDELEEVDLATFTRRCWQTVETGDASLRVATDLRLEADRSRLGQLLENLIRNATEHADRAVTVTVGEMTGGFYVEDDGPGIPEADRNQVFDAGFSTAETGSGFGLNIVAQIAEAHGWEVSLTAGHDGGARFEITRVGADQSDPLDDA